MTSALAAPRMKNPTVFSEFLRLQARTTTNPETGCITVIPRYQTPKGYGEFYSRLAKGHRAHRVLWQLFNGPIEEGLVIHHACHNRACVNLNHLRKITHRENCQDTKLNTKTPSGHRNIYTQRGKYLVRLEANGVTIRRGGIETLEEAVELAVNLRKQYHYKTEGF